MKLIVGLGNPGKEYLKTKHNAGFMALDYFLNDQEFKKKFDGLMLEKNIDTEKVIFFKPMSFMNLSGMPIAKIVNYYSIKPEDILIIHDDLDLDLGKMKLKKGGKSGGHNGIKSIEQQLKSTNFNRLKIGIGRPEQQTVSDYVLSKFSKSELEKINFGIIENIVIDFIKIDFDALMNKYNALIN